MRRRWIIGTTLTGILLLTLGSAPVPAVINLIAGECQIAVQVTTQPDGSREISTPVAGDCETSDGPADGFLGGSFGPFPAFDCEGGVGDGTATFQLDLDAGGSLGWTGADLDVTNNGGVIKLAFFELGSPHLLASGTFVQHPEETVDCMNGDTTVTWTGVIVFEDPEIAP